MKSFFQRRAGVSFFQNEVVSIGIRNQFVELVFKLSGGWYGIVNVVPTADGVLLFTVWGEALNQLYKVLPEIGFREGQCTLLRGILSGSNDNAKIISMNSPEDESPMRVLGVTMKCDTRRNMIATVGDQSILDASRRHIAVALELYSELRTSAIPQLTSLPNLI